MKMGEIRVRPDGGFTMQTPDGVRDITLRATHTGKVLVEDIAGGGMSIRSLVINREKTEVNTDAVRMAQEARVQLERGNDNGA